MSIKLLTECLLEFLSLKGGCTGSSESSLVKTPHCWKSRAAAHFYKPHDVVKLMHDEHTLILSFFLLTRFTIEHEKSENGYKQDYRTKWLKKVLSCQPRVTVTSCFVYKVIRV